MIITHLLNKSRNFY
jgi:hypothetical protein